MPKVSIITPTYNRAETLPRAIESVQAQTFRGYEHIIVDDGSTDETEDVVASVDDDRIRYIPLESNQGANVARNRGIQEANGEFIAFLDSDDEYLPHRLEVTTSALEQQNEDVGGVYHAYECVTDGDVFRVSTAQDGRIELADLVQKSLIGGFSCTMFRAEVFDQVGRLDEQLLASQDYDFYLRVLRDFYIVGITEILSRYHTDVKGIRDNPESVRRGQDRIVEKHADVLADQRISRHHYSRSFSYAKQGDMRRTRKELRTAISIYPHNPIYYYHYLTSFGGEITFDAAIRLKNRVKMAVTK